MNQNLVETIIVQDHSSTRFETFCNAIVSAAEGGRTVVGTSASWDLGRDGRGISGDGLFVCASLSDRVDAKANNDVRRHGTRYRKPCTLYFCSSQPLSELRCDEIEGELQKLLRDGSSVTVLGQQQLAELTVKHPAPFLKAYRAEWEDCLALLRSEGDGKHEETEGLRLALITSETNDSLAIRQGLYRALVLRVIGPSSSRTAGDIAAKVSNELGLARALGVEALIPHIGHMEDCGFLVDSAAGLSLTDKGCAALRKDDEEAARKLVEGRVVIRDALEEEIGGRLADEHYERIWAIFREKIAHAFYMRGSALLTAVSSLLGQDTTDQVLDVDAIASVVDEIAKAVALTSSLAAQQEELRLAVHDIFMEPTGPAFEWLEHTCAAFVALCSLGIEVTSGKAIADVLRRTALILDTDIVLSLLGAGEPEHEAAEAVARRWKRFGGHLLVADPVLHEAGYHATIAENDYRENQSWLPGTRLDRLRLIDNAFVRGFAELMSQGKAHRGQWKRYIAQFSGSYRGDSQRVLSILQEEYGVDRLAPATIDEAKLLERARMFLRDAAGRRQTGNALSRALDKAERDSQLYVAMVRYIKNRRDQEPGALCYLISSARRLADVEAHLSVTNEPRVVVPLSVAVHLISLAPDVKIGLRAMGTFLVDEKRRRFSSDLERMLLRVVKASKEVDVPWARRSALIRRVRDRLLEEAEAKGVASTGDERRSEAVTKIFKDRESESAVVESVREALDNLALDTKTQQENAELRRTVATLKQEIELLKGVTAVTADSNPGRD